tara:strand:- start:941 stop:1438 length:498 start_codon:yes stop_codon:yes gene_type:complete
MKHGACIINTDEMRICKSCKRELPITEFEVFKEKNTIRGDCNACKYAKRNAIETSTPHRYLTRLATRLKSSRRKTHDWNLVPEDLHALWDIQNGRCAVSGIQMTHHVDGRGVKEFNASVDRINNDIDYTPQNVQLVCYRVNIMRHNLSTDMMWWWVKTIHDFSCE